MTARGRGKAARRSRGGIRGNGGFQFGGKMMDKAELGAEGARGGSGADKRRRGLLRSVASTFALACGMLAHAEAGAQVRPEQDIPPVFKAIDENGVELVSRKLNLVMASISIGSGGPGSFVYNWGTSNSTQREVFGFIDINSTTSKYTVTIGGTTETFTLASGAFTQDQGRSSTLSYDSGSERYTYTRSDGSVGIFSRRVSSGDPDPIPQLLTLTYRAGEKLTYHYQAIRRRPAIPTLITWSARWPAIWDTSCVTPMSRNPIGTA